MKDCLFQHTQYLGRTKTWKNQYSHYDAREEREQRQLNKIKLLEKRKRVEKVRAEYLEQKRLGLI
jgi:hypothetical protein